MSLADELSALKAHGVTSAEFYEDGRLKRVEMGPSAGPLDLPGLDDDTRGIMVLPTEVTGGGQPRGGPATAPRQPSAKPRDLLRDLILADLDEPPAMDENDLPEEDNGSWRAEIPAEGEAPVGSGETGLPNLGPGQDT